MYTNENTGVCSWSYGNRFYTSEPTDEEAWHTMSTTHQIINEAVDEDTRDDMIQGAKLLLSIKGQKKK